MSTRPTPLLLTVAVLCCATPFAAEAQALQRCPVSFGRKRRPALTL